MISSSSPICSTLPTSPDYPFSYIHASPESPRMSRKLGFTSPAQIDIKSTLRHRRSVFPMWRLFTRSSRKEMVPFRSRRQALQPPAFQPPPSSLKRQRSFCHWASNVHQRDWNAHRHRNADESTPTVRLATVTVHPTITGSASVVELRLQDGDDVERTINIDQARTCQVVAIGTSESNTAEWTGPAKLGSAGIVLAAVHGIIAAR